MVDYNLLEELSITDEMVDEELANAFGDDSSVGIIKEKIETIARDVYGADGVEYSAAANQQIADFEKSGFGYLPICMAKTHLSISHDPALKGAPKGYTIPVREVRASVGAGFIYPLLGEMRTMPGLGTKPAYMQVDIDDAGNVVGLF